MKEYNVSFNTEKLTGHQVAEIVKMANKMDESVTFWGASTLLHINTNNIYLCRQLRDYKVLFNA